jgi:RecJ-like exonuclease
LAGPLLVFIGYKTGEKFIMNETFTGSDKVSADYTIAARDLLYEFNTNDKAANEKYLEKMLIVNGVVSNVERLSDSTTTIQFSDSTGSYIVFALDKNQFRDTENINAGDLVSLKGSCSGSIHSQILGTTSISFKRSTIIK